MESIFSRTYVETIRIGIVTAVGIILTSTLKIAALYHLVSLDFSFALVGISFLAIGYFLFSPKEKQSIAKSLFPIESLTVRELAILKILLDGKTNKEIASILVVEVSTVKTHLNNLYTKLKCKNRREVIAKFQNNSYS